jgi:hypothetical protein
MYQKLLLIVKKVVSFFKPKNLSQNISDNHQTKMTSEPFLPDTTTLEQTMFMLQRIRTVFDFTPPIPLITEMRIINRGLSQTYHTANIYDKKIMASEITDTVRKFSYILPEIDFLLTKIENISAHKSLTDDTESIKKQIIDALEKVSYDENALNISKDNHYLLEDKKNYYISFDDTKK